MSLEIQLKSNEHWALFSQGNDIAEGVCDFELTKDRLHSEFISIVLSPYSVLHIIEGGQKLKYSVIVTHQDGEWNHTVVKE